MSSIPADDQQQLEENTKSKHRRHSNASDTTSQLQTTSTMSLEQAIETTTTVDHTKQSLQDRRSSHWKTEKRNKQQQLQRLRTHESQRTESSYCTGDVDILSLNEIPLVLQSRTQENPHNVHVDTKGEKIQTTDSIQDVGADGFEKGITATKEKGMETMAKKCKALFSRSTGVLALVIVGGIIVAGGVVVCQMYPLSSAAGLIRDSAGWVKKSLSTLLRNIWNMAKLSIKNLGQVVEFKWLTLLRSKRLAETARATKMQALQGICGLFKPIKVVTMCFRLIEGLRDQSRLVLLGVVYVLKLLMEWIRSGFMELTDKGELIEQVQALFLTAFSFFAEALSQCKAVTALSLGKVFEWLGMESEMSDANLPGEHFLAPLVTHQAAIQNIGRGLTAQQFRAVHDVKRFEKRRTTIASTTNSIIEDTRAVALESVRNVKMAAVEFIEERTRQLAEQYVQAFEQSFTDYERTSWQVEEEGGSEMLAEITLESQAQLNAAASLKRYLLMHEKIVDEKLMEAVLLGDRMSMKHMSRDERVSEGHLVDSQLNGERKLSGDTKSLVSKEQSPAADMPDSDLDTKEESQTRVEIAKLATVERKEASALKYSAPEKASESELFSKEQANVLTVEYTEASVVGKSRSSEKAVEGDHVTEDQLKTVAKHTEIDLLSAALEPMDGNEAIDEVEQTFAAQVSVELDNALLEMELIQAQASKRVDVRNLSEEKVQVQQESGVERNSKASIDGTDMKLVEKLTAIADKSFEEIEVKQPHIDAATQTAIVAEGNMEKQMMEVIQCFQEDCITILQADEKETATQSEQMDAEFVLKVQVDIDDAMVFTELRPSQEESASIHRYDEAVVEVEIQKGPVGVAVEAQRERTGYLEIEVNADVADLNDVDMLESERIVMVEEILELEQLEQVLLQEEAERMRVEEELRVIAEEEKIWLPTDQAPAEGVSQMVAVEQRTIDVTKHADAVADFKSEDRQSSTRDTLLGLPRPISTQIGLFSMAFFVLAALTAYFFVRHRKRGFLARSPCRRMRWQQLAHVDEFEAEEVVLLSDVSSNEEDDTDADAAAVKQPKTKVIGRMANVDVEAIELVSSEGEEDVEKEEIGANHKNAEEEEDTVKEEDLNAERSRLIVTEHAQTIIYTADHSDMSNLDAVDGDAASVIPMAPGQETPDTPQRARLRQRGIRT